jgi:hypothetical protein
MRQQPKVTLTTFQEIRPGDVVVVRHVGRHGQTSLITDKLGAVTKIHVDVPCAEIMVQSCRVYFDGLWFQGRNIPCDPLKVFIPNTPNLFLMRVLPD